MLAVVWRCPTTAESCILQLKALTDCQTDHSRCHCAGCSVALSHNCRILYPSAEGTDCQTDHTIDVTVLAVVWRCPTTAESCILQLKALADSQTDHTIDVTVLAVVWCCSTTAESCILQLKAPTDCQTDHTVDVTVLAVALSHNRGSL